MTMADPPRTNRVTAETARVDPARVHDPIHHPAHYNSGPPCPGCGRRIECIDITRQLGFAIGNAIKYLWRVGFGGKAGVDPVEDLGKAAWYVTDEIDRRRPSKEDG